MFNQLATLPSAHFAALEELTDSEEREKKKREFIISRLERRWNFNKGSLGKARTLKQQFESNILKIKKHIGSGRFDERKFSSLVERKQFISAKLMADGLSQIPKLSLVFSDIASHPPSMEKGNLPLFKALMASSLKRHAPAYTYSSYQIYARFMAYKALFKKNGNLKDAGYTEGFIKQVESSIESIDILIKQMEGHEELIHKLSGEIADALLGPKGKEYQHARRQFELVCTQWTSILTLAPWQYLNLAISTTNTISECYRDFPKVHSIK